MQVESIISPYDNFIVVFDFPLQDKVQNVGFYFVESLIEAAKNPNSVGVWKRK